MVNKINLTDIRSKILNFKFSEPEILKSDLDLDLDWDLYLDLDFNCTDPKSEI